MSIADCIARLQAASVAIATAITDKGGVVNSGDGFEEYPSDIRTIPTGASVIPVTITATPTTSSITLTLDKAIPVALSVAMTLQGDTTNYTIASGATSLSISVGTYTASRTAYFTITPSSYASLFSLTYPSSVDIPYDRRQVNLYVENITSTGCSVRADNNPSSDLTIVVTLGGSTYSGIIYNDSLSCVIAWNAPLAETTAFVACQPSSDEWADYVLDVTDFQVPAGSQTYTVIKCIEGTGTQYIQTNITTAYGMIVVSKFWGQAPNSTTGGTNGDGTNILWAGGNQSDILMYTSAGARLYAGNGSYLRYRANNAGYTAGRYLKLLVNIDGGTGSSASRLGYIEGTSESIFNNTSFTAVPSSSQSQTPSYGAIHIGKTPSRTNPSPFKFYGLEITENNVATHSLVPAIRDADGEVGVLDQTTDTFYANAGSGDFLYEVF